MGSLLTFLAESKDTGGSFTLIEGQFSRQALENVCFCLGSSRTLSLSDLLGSAL
jgi:hypothetical protein